LVEESANLPGIGICAQHGTDLLADTLGGKAKVNLQNLADVHPRWNTEWVQHDIDRIAIFHVRHVFHGQDT
jgi:hypothetical protein